MKKTLLPIAVGLLAAGVLTAAVSFAAWMYSAPAVHSALVRTERLQGLARALHDGVHDVYQGDFSALAAIRRDEARTAAIMDRWREAYGGGWTPAYLLLPVERMRRVSDDWNDARKRLDDLLDHEQVLKGIGRTIAMLDQTAASLLAQSETIVQDLVTEGGDDRDIYFASRQIVLIQRISEHLHELLHPAYRRGSLTDSPGYRALVGDAAAFEHTLEALLKGDNGPGAAAGGGVQPALRANSKMFVSVNRDVGRILAMVPALQDVQRNMQGLSAASLRLASESDGLVAALVTREAHYEAAFAAAYLAAVAALVLLFAYGVYTRRRTAGRVAFALAQSKRYRSILSRLRPALEQLARGDLSAKPLKCDEGMEAVTVPFNQVVARLRDAVTAVKDGTAELTSSIERINAAGEGITHDNGRQIEHTAAASATLNRLLTAVERASSRVAESERGLETLEERCAAVRGRITEGTPPAGGAPGGDHGDARRLEALNAQVGTLTEGIEELSVLVLHLLVREQDAGQGAHEPVPYANRALQAAHQCTEAVKQLDQGLAQLREAADRRDVDASGLSAETSPRPALLQETDEHLAAAQTDARRVVALLRDTTALLGDLAKASSSISGDLDGIHEYTMRSSSEAADALDAGRRSAELVAQIGRSIDKYNVMR